MHTSTILWFTVGVITSEISTWILRWLGKRDGRVQRRKPVQVPLSKFETMVNPDLDNYKPHDVWNTVIFFPVDPAYSNPLTQMLYYFENTKVKIRICIELSSLFEIRDIVLNKKQKEGLLVQVITDYDTLTSNTSSSCKAYVRARIPVRARNTGYLMHHKFVIFDDQAVMTGSLNQTKQAVIGNDENVVMTTNPVVVQRYIREFGKIWKDLEDVKMSMFPVRIEGNAGPTQAVFERKR